MISEARASLRFARVGAQKARLVADLVRGKDLSEAIKTLSFLNKKSGLLLKKLIESAAANAENNLSLDLEKLFIKEIFVNQGPPMKRFRPRAQGRAYGIKKKTSHINVVLGEK